MIQISNNILKVKEKLLNFHCRIKNDHTNIQCEYDSYAYKT